MQEIGASQENVTGSGISRFLGERLARLSEEIEARISTEIDGAVIAAGYKSRRAAHEEINQIMRRLRPCVSTEEVATWLVDSTSPFTSRAALFEVTATRLRGVRMRGFSSEPD